MIAAFFSECRIRVAIVKPLLGRNYEGVNVGLSSVCKVRQWLAAVALDLLGQTRVDISDILLI
jgi:hypothetical protein